MLDILLKAEKPGITHFGAYHRPPDGHFFPKNAERKDCPIFVTFPRYVNGVLETTFYSQVTFGHTRRGQNW